MTYHRRSPAKSDDANGITTVSASAARPPRGARRPRAKDIVERTIRAAIPPGVPTSHTIVLSARYTGGRNIVATLEMFDRRPATVELARCGGLGWSLRYRDLPGGAVMWTGDRWKRDTTNARHARP